MGDVSRFGGDSAMDAAQDQGSSFGSGLSFGTPAPEPAGPEAPAMASPAPAPSFGQGLRSILPGPHYRAPDPQASALDQTADTLQQRIERANTVATNPLLQVFNPEGVQAARDFVPKATEALQKIKQQKADMQANRQQAATLGLDPGEVADEATMADRVEAARSRALTGDLKVFKGLQAVDPKTAEAIQDQVHEVVAGHLGKAQLAFDSLSGMQNQGQYEAKLNQLRKDGTLTDLEALGLKVPPSFNAFNANKAREGQALREARIGVDTIRQKLEERNTYQPMEEKEAKTYAGRMTTAYGDQISNGTWGRNASSNARGLIVNGAGDPRELRSPDGKGTFTLATPEQRKEISEAGKTAVPKEDIEKYRAFNRTYELATKDAKGNPLPADKINTNPNVQQGVAEGLASMLRGGTGGANVGLLKIELAKRGWAQGAIDGLVSNYAGALNTLFDSANKKDYQSANTQRQIRDVMDVLKTYTGNDISDRIGSLAERAGALGLDRTVFGLGSKESAGVVDEAMERGRQAQIARMLPNHQAIGGGDGVFQLGAQRPGAGATAANPGTTPTTQLPGAQPLQTPVQQATQSPAPPNGSPPPAGPSAAPTVAPGTSPAPVGGGAPPAPVQPAPATIAGQSVTVPPLPPGASPRYLEKTQRIESGNERDPWKAGTDKSSATGAFQFINSTWAADKPPGAPDRAKDATPQQQTEAAANRAVKNAAVLTKAGLPVNDTNLYIAHNLGEGAGPKLLQADPNADARTVVGERAAANNPLFFRGKPTVAKVLERYDAEMNRDPDEPKPRPGAGGATAEAPGLLQRISRALMQGVPSGERDKAAADVGNAAVEHAPAIGSTLGAIGGTAAVPGVGTVAGGAAGGGAGQALKDYLQGRAQSPTGIAKEAALGGVLGVGTAARPVLSAAARVVGAGGVEAGAKVAEGGDASDAVDAGLHGAASAAGGEAFGRALGMVGHKVFSMFAPNAQKTVQAAAKTYSEAEATLANEAPKLPGVGGAAGSPNPKYEAAEAAKAKAETVLKDAGLKPEEAAYAHKVSTTDNGNIPHKLQEAEVGRPGALEKDRIGAGYQQMEAEVGATGKGAPKAAPKLADGPIAAVESKAVSAKHAELAQHTEMAITAPAANWQEKWAQLKDARSALLTAERDALSSTAPGRTKEAADMRVLADAVRKQQEKAAKYVFGEKDGEAFMARLKVLDVRYRNLMEATNGGDLMAASALRGDAGREAERKFVAFAHDDPQAIEAYRAMRKHGGDPEKTVPWTVVLEGIPVLKHLKLAVLADMLKKKVAENVAGSPVKFSDLVRQNQGAPAIGQNLRDLGGTAAQRGAVM